MPVVAAAAESLWGSIAVGRCGSRGTYWRLHGVGLATSLTGWCTDSVVLELAEGPLAVLFLEPLKARVFLVDL